MTYEDLPERAKERLRDEHRDVNTDHDWWDACYEDFQRVGDILGVTFGTTTRTTSRGKPYTELKIYFSSFSCQGDGLCFSGTYQHVPNAMTKIKEYAPQDEKLHAIAETLTAAQVACKLEHGTFMHANIEGSDRYYSLSVSTEFVDPREDGRKPNECGQLDDPIIDAMEAFQRWMYLSLEAEYTYLTSDEVIDEWLSENYDLASLEEEETT